MASEKKPDWVKVNDDGTVTVTLVKPIDVNGAKVGYLVMREPTVDDHIVANGQKGDDLTKEAALFANLCTVPPADVRRLPMRDFMRLQAAYSANFFD
jgi:hypothetical protein